jgi:hypothetical protein
VEKPRPAGHALPASRSQRLKPKGLAGKEYPDLALSQMAAVRRFDYAFCHRHSGSWNDGLLE